MHKRLLIGLLGALLLHGFASAQEAPQKVDSDIFSIHAGLKAGFSLNSGATTVGRTVGIDFTVADNLKLGFLSIDGQAGLDDFALMSMMYYVSDAIGLEIMFGTHGAAIASGLEGFLSIGKSNPGRFKTTLKTSIGYLFDATTGIQNGTISAGLLASVGL